MKESSNNWKMATMVILAIVLTGGLSYMFFKNKNQESTNSNSEDEQPTKKERETPDNNQAPTPEPSPAPAPEPKIEFALSDDGKEGNFKISYGKDSPPWVGTHIRGNDDKSSVQGEVIFKVRKSSAPVADTSQRLRTGEDYFLKLSIEKGAEELESLVVDMNTGTYYWKNGMIIHADK